MVAPTAGSVTTDTTEMMNSSETLAVVCPWWCPKSPVCRSCGVLAFLRPGDGR